jgi:hypothetical protein
MADRVRALLIKAESTTFPEEAEALTAKAQQLMAKYAIDQLAIDIERGATGGPSGVESREFSLDESYASPKSMLLGSVAHANRCNAVWSGYRKVATVFGLPSDLDAVELLFTSLLTQATTAMLAASPPGAHGSSVRSFRHSFLIAYASRIGQRLDEVARQATEEAVASHGGDESDLMPVLLRNEQAVAKAVAEAFPRLHSRRLSISNGRGFQAGTAAADRADLGRSSGRLRAG